MKAPRKAPHKALLLGFAVALTLTAGCGQKAGVNTQYLVDGQQQGSGVNAGGSIGGSGSNGDGGLSGGSGDGSGTLSGGGGSGSGGSSGTSGGNNGGTGNGSTGGNGGGAGNDGGGDNGGQDNGGSAGDSTGVTDTTIKIGMHAPVTGAAAIPQASFEKAVGVYFDAVNRAGGINGRKVEVLFEDDGFDPNRARSVCKTMVEQEKVFMLIGGAGADQIDACARYANASGVPYLSAGVHQTRPGLGPLGNLSTYFALTLAYEQQIPLLARLVKTQYAGDKVGVIVADNDSLDNFYDIADGSIKSVAGDNLVLSRRIPKNTTSDAPAVGTAICQSQAKVVLWNASPSSFLNVLKAMPCTVTFIGPGLTNGLNIVAQVGCPNVDGSMFYSPMPGLDVMRQDKAFVGAYQAKNNAAPDDIGAAIYGLEQMTGSILQATGRNLTRESFMSTIARVKNFAPGVFPPASFSTRFGGTGMNLLKADCSKNEFVTVRRNERP